MVAPHCCCDIPTQDEQKTIVLTVPWNGFPKRLGFGQGNIAGFISTARFSTGWNHKKYLRIVYTLSNHTGTYTRVIVYDKDSGQRSITTSQPPGFVAYLPSDNSIVPTLTPSDNPTHFERSGSYTAGAPTPTYTSTEVCDLTDEIEFSEKVAEWRGFLDSFLPLEQFRSNPSFTADYFGTDQTFQWKFFSEYAYATPNTHSYYNLNPTATFPWDGKVTIQAQNDLDVIPNADPLGASPYFGRFLQGQYFFGHTVLDNDEVSFWLSCLAIKEPLDCTRPTGYPGQIISPGVVVTPIQTDIGIVTFDAATPGSNLAMTISAGSAILSAGYHSFNGLRVYSHSGSLVQGSASIPTSNGTDTGFGWVGLKQTPLGDPYFTNVFTMANVPDYCPP